MCVCTHMCVCTYVYTCMCTYVYTCMCAYVYVCVLQWQDGQRDVRKQPWVSVLAFHLIWDKVSCLPLHKYIRLIDQWASGDSVVSSSRHPKRALELQMGTTMFNFFFTWILGIRTQVLTHQGQLRCWRLLEPHYLSRVFVWATLTTVVKTRCWHVMC